MSLLIDQAWSKIPKEKKKKETVNDKLNMEMKNRDKIIIETRKKTNDNKSQLIWLRVKWLYFDEYKIACIFTHQKKRKEIPLH